MTTAIFEGHGLLFEGGAGKFWQPRTAIVEEIDYGSSKVREGKRGPSRLDMIYSWYEHACLGN
jgi:hypothetical protein